ncbi:ribosome maturation factor RimP [Campylobacter fetus]|uniref:Ribosome maturation factor RimP n=4 Tax=Campylobacter fetus TaxID=196 RepID=RIMP_CAMFF|nr:MULTISPECIES: ribosome maturation factor RimP [Campylobacter]A0RQZ2.1 RecName: Full=Ribosome maturation factor RimP [Campylobacter fetus subsp. fetus 82-40]OCS22193.1 ribosome maturation factor RimP [Campylobacter fetus subsp. venerealis cfvi97/532]OCS25807.1 ribosome maturation factor RimP [Campylobacter fetus subsp. venerealis cfvB10]OCS29185.1 ribosome maturation factor RimP [Campylobacter fetus subsp. venerealis LMG 6570 = CCUG 33900]OCS43368.1 ribosome maturation factor RimP [Campyloba
MTDLSNLVSQCGVDLYDAEVVNENGRVIYRVYITKNGGVSLEECEAVSKLLSPIYDVMPPVSGEWILEVSSPGLERKLSKIEHFTLSIGEFAKIILNDKTEIKGKIVSVKDDNICINIKNNESIEVKFENIKKAKTYMEW